MSDSLRPHALQHARPRCPSPTPGVYVNSCPLSQWWHPTISSSVGPFSSCLQSFPASGSFPMVIWISKCTAFFFFQLDGIAALVLNSCLVINGWTSVATVSIGWVLIILLLMTPPFHSVVLQAWTMSILQCKHHGNSFIFSASPLPILKSTMIIYSLDILSGLPKGTSAFCLSRLPTFPNQIATVQIDCTFCNTDLTTSQ